MASSNSELEDDDQEAVPRPYSVPSVPHASAGKEGGKRKLRFYGHGMPYLKDLEVKGHLIVIEGPDASGRSTHTTTIQAKLEADGHAVLGTGLKRSELISEGII